ncbi:MAG: S10 family serine carboxypeptidase-like protein [Rhodoplanes sp.]
MTPKTNQSPSPLRRLIYALVLAAAAGALAMGASAPAFSQAQRQTQPPSEARRSSAPPPAAERPSTPAGEADRAAAPTADTGRPAPPIETVQQPAGRDRGGQEATRKLPADATSDHALALPGRTLRFKATSGSIPLFDGDGGKLEAEVAYIAYTVGDAAAGRPVTFAFNGGPGAASAYLNIGGLGPWRLPFDRITASGSAALVPNAETWLDFTDLVFIDPPGTGYSRLVGGDEARRSIWSVDGDADALALFIRKWIDQNGRQGAPKFLVGESYGGMRALKIERALEQHQGVGVRGLVLISPVLDFASLGQRRHAPLSYVANLPSMAATARELNGGFDRAALAAVENYAAGEYLADLMRGERDQAAVKRISARVAALTGLDPALVERLGGRIDSGTFQREFYRARGLVGSAYDATVTAFDPNPSAAQSSFSDPVLDASRAPLVSAMTGLYQSVLNWRPDQPYRLLNGEVGSRWNWGRGRAAVHAVDDLRTVLASDWRTHVLVAHGASDLVTPYYANKLILDQLPVYGSPERARLAVYGGGHMFYSRDASRRDLRSDAEALYRAALTSERPAGE